MPLECGCDLLLSTEYNNHQNKLSAFNVQMLKNILSHLEVPFKSKDKKSIITRKLREVIRACKCDATLYA